MNILKLLLQDPRESLPTFEIKFNEKTGAGHVIRTFLQPQPTALPLVFAVVIWDMKMTSSLWRTSSWVGSIYTAISRQIR